MALRVTRPGMISSPEWTNAGEYQIISPTLTCTLSAEAQAGFSKAQ